MKLRNALLLCPAVWAFSLAAGRAQPLARVAISSFEELSNAVVRVAGAVALDSHKELGRQFTAKLGLTNSATFDTKGSWEVAVWQVDDSPATLVAVKGPIADVKKFRSELSSAGWLATLGKDWVQLEKGSAAIVFKDAEAQSEAEKTELKRWEETSLSPPRRTLELTLAPNETARARVLPFLTMARMSLSQGAAAAGGANPKPIGEMFDLYFDAIEGFVKGFQEVKLTAGATADSLVLEETISAKPGTALAKWIAKPAHPVTADDLSALTPEAVVSGAVTLPKDARLTELAQRFIRLSFEMQNQATNDPALDDLAALVGNCLPAGLSGSVSFKDRMEFWGVYRFPESDAATVYGQMKPLLARLAKTQAGKGKMYSAASFTEKHHTTGGVPVDRFSCTLDLNNPLFQQPGQQEQLKAMWPNGTMEFDYAVKNGQLLAATPDRTQGLLERSNRPKSGSAFVTDDSTVAAGYFNLLSAIKELSGANPAIPDALKDRMARVDPKGTAIRFQLEMNSQVRCEQHLPLKLIEQLGHLKD